MPSWAPGRSFAWCRRLATAWWRVSLTRVDLPEPETPVTQQKTPSGIATSIVLEVVFAGAADDAARRVGLRRSAGTSIRRLPERYWPVSEAGFGGDLAPACPRRPRGRRARRRRGRGRRGGRRRASSPRRARRRSPCCRGRAAGRGSPISFSLSRWCRPIEGSSRMYMTPTRLEPIWVASRIRCASPPESVRAERASER